jgi:trk system potassium uptake protein TrkH
MRSILSVLNFLGGLLALFALYFLPPILTALVLGEHALVGFLIGAGVSGGLGLALRAATWRYRGTLRPRDGYLLVSATWPALAAVATIPLLLELPELGFTDAFFETMSGLSTTGATVLSGLDALPRSVLLWRHALSWLGGMGVIVLAVAVLPLLGIGGMQIHRAETPGGLKHFSLGPRIAETARLLWTVYAILTAACFAALWGAGMRPFDALCHALSTLALGGFSTHDANIAWFDSPLIEFVLVAFALLAAVNFTTHFLALRRGDLKLYARDPEARWLFAWIGVSCVAVALDIWLVGGYPDFFTALRHAGFNVVSFATSAGFVGADYTHWPAFAPMWMLLLACLCASTGSTGGGIKMFRSLVLIKQSLREMFTLVHPQAVLPLKVAHQVVPNRVVYGVLAYIFLYFMAIAFLTFALLASGLDFVSAFTAIVACANNVGAGLGLIGPQGDYAALNVFQTWVCALAMFVGRIEIITFAVLFTPTFWRK